MAGIEFPEELAKALKADQLKRQERFAFLVHYPMLERERKHPMQYREYLKPVILIDTKPKTRFTSINADRNPTDGS